jgi:uncharacterized protein
LTRPLGEPLDHVKSEGDLVAFMARRPAMTRVLQAVAALALPDCWVGAGFIRNAVWDSLHGWSSSPHQADVDVIFFDPEDVRPERDAGIERTLAAAHPDVPWSARNQARMHVRNGDPPYADSADAVRHWPERCTAIAARAAGDRIELLAPFGIGDLADLVVRPTPAFVGKMSVYRERAGQKDWLNRWPRLRVFGAEGE